MRRKRKLLYVLTFLVSLNMVLEAPVMAEVVACACLPIRVTVNVTTHPDYYNTQLSLEMTSPVVSDLDNDGILEIIGAGYNTETQQSSVFVWQRKGVVQPGWPVTINGRIENIPAVGDLDSDGNNEVIVSVTKSLPDTGGWLYVFHYDGSIYNGYPVSLDFKPGAPLVGDVENDFGAEALVYESNIGAVLCDIDHDGKKEVIKADVSGINILYGKDVTTAGAGSLIWLDWPQDILAIGNPVSGDVDGDEQTEVFLSIMRPSGNYIYGWHCDGTTIEGWPVNIAGVINTPGNLLSLADINGDGTAEVLTGSVNGFVSGWNIDGTVVFSHRQAENEVIYQPLAGDVNNNGDIEIVSLSNTKNIYCYDNNGNLLNGWPYTFNYDIPQSAVLADIDSDSSGDRLNPKGDLELLFGAYDGGIHIIELKGIYNPDNIQWGMYGYNPGNSGNYERDRDTSGWSIFDNEPEGSTIRSVYDWNRGGRVIELKGSELNNTYVFKKIDGRPLNSHNTNLQWSMCYKQSFNIYVSVDTLKGSRYLYYTHTEGNELADSTGMFIHHGLGGDSDNNKWHTYTRNLVQDLKDAQSDNEIVDINAVYVQGSGRISDIMLLPGLPVIELTSLVSNTNINVSSGSNTKDLLNDGDPDTKWVSGDEANSWIEYTLQNQERINRIVITPVEGATGGVILITDASGNVHLMNFSIPNDGRPIEIIFDSINAVNSVRVVFNNSAVMSVGEIGIYYDPNLERQEQEERDSGYIQIKNGYFFNPVNNNYWIPKGIAYITWDSPEKQWQTPLELTNDLDMMKEAGVSAIRVNFTWKSIEALEGEYDWARYDLLLEEAMKRDVKVFPVLEYTEFPDWYSGESYIISSEIRNFLGKITDRYSIGGERENLGAVIAGWILGKIDLKDSENDADEYEKIITDSFASAAGLVRDTDPAHLIGCSIKMAEEVSGNITVIQAFNSSGVDFDFLFISNYSIDVNSELESERPAIVAETGFSTTEDTMPVVNEERQSELIINAVTDALANGASGVSVFHWNDREGRGIPDREKGFGIVYLDRNPKLAYYSVKDIFSKIELSVDPDSNNLLLVYAQEPEDDMDRGTEQNSGIIDAPADTNAAITADTATENTMVSSSETESIAPPITESVTVSAYNDLPNEVKTEVRTIAVFPASVVKTDINERIDTVSEETVVNKEKKKESTENRLLAVRTFAQDADVDLISGIGVSAVEELENISEVPPLAQFQSIIENTELKDINKPVVVQSKKDTAAFNINNIVNKKITFGNNYLCYFQWLEFLFEIPYHKIIIKTKDWLRSFMQNTRFAYKNLSRHVLK